MNRATIVRVALLLAVIFAQAVGARILHVPIEYPTIQEALNDLLDGDTVLVELGTYAESLTAPSVAFTMIGNVEPDTGNYPRPIIDPSSLPNPQEQRCLQLSGGTPIIHDFVFRNGPDMYPRDEVGGVLMSSGTVAEFTHCVFDSTYFGIGWLNGNVVLHDCMFFENQNSCVSLALGRITAINCLFTGNGLEMVLCGGLSQFDNCIFRDNASGHLLSISGTGNVISRCVFGPRPFHPFDPVTANNFGGTFEDCYFTACSGGYNILGLARNCDEPLIFKRNLFTDIHNTSGGAGLGFGCSSGSPGIPAEIQDNVFVNCSATADRKCIGVGPSGANIIHNRFHNILPFGLPTIYCFGSSAFLRDNLFDSTGYAFQSPLVSVAEWNWWGDASGPFHEQLNPNGLGDRVSDNVDFEPWHEDTLFFSGVEPTRPLPESFSLSVYPNPFNNAATLKLSVPRAFIAEINLLNVLGQEVTEIHRGPVYGEESYSINGVNLASGLYFIRVADVFAKTQMATEKIVLLK